MPVLQDPDMLQLNSSEPYNVWKGQLYIQEHLACNIKFKSSSICSLPAQLPRKLEINKVIRLSELRKILPVHIFDKISFAGQEVCCESVYYTLYTVTTSNVKSFEFDKLQEWMKDHELALIKALSDQGFLILLRSSALLPNKDFCVKDPFQLFALFLFPHTKLLNHKSRDDLGYNFKEDISLKVTELLPGLQYAILETRQMLRDKDLYPDALVQQQLKQFVRVHSKNLRAGEVKGEHDTSRLLPNHGEGIPDKCNQLFFSRVQSYFSSPVNYSIPLVKMSSLLKEDVPVASDSSEQCAKKIIVKDLVALESKLPFLAANKVKSDSLSGNDVLNENKKEPAKKKNLRKGGRPTKKGKTKNAHQTALSSSSTSENQVANKKEKLIGGDQQAASSNRTTVKLASAPHSHRRKRGAEVLTAEFVNDDKGDEAEKTAKKQNVKEQITVPKIKITRGKPGTKAPADDKSVRERPPKRKASEPGNRNKFPESKIKPQVIRKTETKKQERPRKHNNKKTTETSSFIPFEPVTSFSKSSTDLSCTTKQSTHQAPVSESNIMEKRMSMYESHALNLLADLALSSFSSSSMSYINSETLAPIGEPVAQEKSPICYSVSAVDYSAPLQSNATTEEPVEASDCLKSPPAVGSEVEHVNSTSPHRIEISGKPTSYKMLIAAAKAKARSNATCKISLEHSYSQLPRDDIPDKPTKELNEKPSQSVSEPTVTSDDNEIAVDNSSDIFIPQEYPVVSNDDECPSVNTELREVSKFQDKYVITLKCEANYDFHLDSKFTSDPLEKTVNRALHGPWNSHLKEKVEDVKIILHMWLALFYSKSSQTLTSRSRKVVEHSNPAKYVSINTVHDPLFEFIETDDSESGPLKNYTCTAPQIMSVVSPLWHKIKKNHNSTQPVDLSVASKRQTKADSGEGEHKYIKFFSSAEEPHRSSGTEKGISMLHEDLCSILGNVGIAKNMSVSPGPVSDAETFSLHSSRLPLIGDEKHKSKGRVEARPQDHTSSTVDPETASPNALNINSAEDVFNEDDGHSDHSDHTGEDFLKRRSPLVSRMLPIQNTNSKKSETLLQSTDTRHLTEPKLQDINMDSAMENNETNPSNVHSTITSSKGNSNIDDLQSSSIDDNQTNVTSSISENLSPLPTLNSGSSIAHLEEGKTAEFGIMGKLQLSPSSNEISDVEDMDTDNADKPNPDKADEEKLHSNEKSDLVDSSAEPCVVKFIQDDRSPKDDGSQVNRNTEAIEVTDHSTEMNKTGKSDVDDNVSTVSIDFHKGTKAVDSSFHNSGEVKSISEVHKNKDPPDNLHSFPAKEVSPTISADLSQEDSELSKAVDLESATHNSSLLRSESSNATDLESIGENPLMPSKATDIECTPLSLKTVHEKCTTQDFTLGEKQELQTHNKKLTEHKNMDNNPPIETLSLEPELCGSSVLVTEDHIIPVRTETGKSSEVLKSQCIEILEEDTSAISLCGKSKSNKAQKEANGANDSTSKCVDGNVDQALPAETLSDSILDAGSVRLSSDQPVQSPRPDQRLAKDQTQSMKNTIREEILSKLKLICQGSGISQHASSNSEDEVYIVHEKPGKRGTGEQTDEKITELSKDDINAAGLVESASEIQEKSPKSVILKEDAVQEKTEDNLSVASLEPVHVQEEEQSISQDKCISPVHNDVAENMEQDFGQDQSEICCILNTGSISKEQYDRWSETSDEDIEFIQAYTEPLTSEYLRKECYESSSSPAALTSFSEPNQLEKTQDSTKQSGPSTSPLETEEHAPRHHRNTENPSPRSQDSFSITKKLNDVERAWHSVPKDLVYSGRSDLDGLFTDRRMVSSDLTQYTLDMEHLRFMCRLKEVLRKTSADVHVSETSHQTMFGSRKIPGCSASRNKCKSPLLITVNCAQRRRDYKGHASGLPSTSYSRAYYHDELRHRPAYLSRTPRKMRTPRSSPYHHFNRLRYESAMEKPDSDISVIINECTQSNRLNLSRVSLASSAVQRTSVCQVPEENDWQTRKNSNPSTKSHTVVNIISDLRSNLLTKLHGVARESTQRNHYFYLGQDMDDQEDNEFFSLTKSLLIKDGYTPIEPQDFCSSEESEYDKLLILLRNENVSSQLHKIPCLLQLRLLSNVTFVGVDTPEDLSESMHQDLLQIGGFVVSDKGLLENIPMGKLKEILKILEKMNRSSPWKWLIHYGEYRKLKEDKRADSTSRMKIPLLKTYQQSNVIEVLPYHQCDSRSKELSMDLKCLLSLQSQHIRSRLAVCLTAMPSTEAEEFERNGILVYDVDTFIRRIQKVDAQLQSSF